MVDRNYHQEIMKRIVSSIDKLLPIGSLIALLGIVNVILTGRSLYLAYYDLALSIGLFLLYLFRKNIGPELKIALISALILFLGILSLILTGIIGIGPQLLILTSILVVGFFPMGISSLYAMIKAVFLIFYVFAIYMDIVQYQDPYASLSNQISNWYMLVLLLTLLDAVLIFVISAIKKFLIAMIKTSDIHVKKIYQLAYTDALSQLPNKAKLLDYYQRETLKPGVIIHFFIDGLSMMNSIYGTEKTDQYIRYLATLMRTYGKSEHLIARLSGNDFLIIFEETPEDEALIRYQKLVYDLITFELNHHARQILQIHAGYLEITSHDITLSSALEKTSIALEQAKMEKALQPLPYDTQSEKRFLEQEALKSSLTQAIREKAFTIYYQEKVDTQLNQVIGLEALARWSPSDDVFIPPNTFIPLLKKINQTLEFDLMIIDKVFTEYPFLVQKYTSPISVSINISPLSLITQSFVDQVVQLSRKKAIIPNNFYFELTEDAFFETFDAANDGIEQLRARGFKISIDDFGSGYTALSYIFKLQFDELKMDRTFVHQLSESPVNCAILKTLLALQETYHFSIVAEGVETQVECEMLQKMGCWQVQGYLFSVPIPCVISKGVATTESYTGIKH